MYQYNLQGDVIGIINGGHGQRVFYEYDTWGKRLSLNGGSRDDIGIYNPFLYRHYQYDVETGLYYLNSRYAMSEKAYYRIEDDGTIRSIESSRR